MDWLNKVLRIIVFSFFTGIVIIFALVLLKDYPFYMWLAIVLAVLADIGYTIYEILR